MGKHRFAIIEDFDKNRDYSHDEAEKYNCISVDEELINGIVKYLRNFKTYENIYGNQIKGLAKNGVTLIPSSSVMFLHDIASTSNRFKKSKELTELTALTMEAKVKDKYIIHYGV